MASNFDINAEKAIPAEVRMISGCHDAQTSADVSNVGSFQLPDPAGRAGGACTAALLQVLYRDHRAPEADLSWVDVLRRMRSELGGQGFDQVPQLTSSRMIDMDDPFRIVNPAGPAGVRRAVLIGINYVGQQGQLSGCHNDVHNMKDYLMSVHGFEDANITVMMDDGIHQEPTRANILGAYRRLVAQSFDGDTVFCHYSGHGGQLRDDSGDEDDGFDETLIPVDFQHAGQIRDDDLFKELVHPMAAGVTMTCLMDCCHSGTVLDLPYRFVADGDHIKMERNDAVAANFEDFLGAAFFAVAVSSAVGGGDDDDDDFDCCGCLGCLYSIISAFTSDEDSE